MVELALSEHGQDQSEQGAAAVAELTDFDAVYRDYAKFIWSILRRLGVPESSVDDVLQEVFVVAYRRRESFEGRAPLRSWLYGIALRVARAHNRKLALRRWLFFPLSDDDRTADSTSPDVVERKEALAFVDATLKKMPRKQREVFVFSELEELTAQEIAPLVGCNVNTVYSRLRLARQRFEAAVKRHQSGAAEVSP